MSLKIFIEIFSRLTRSLEPDNAYTQCLEGSTERNIIENVTTLYMNFAKFGYLYHEHQFLVNINFVLLSFFKKSDAR